MDTLPKPDKFKKRKKESPEVKDKGYVRGQGYPVISKKLH
jgi:hypothetical protein